MGVGKQAAVATLIQVFAQGWTRLRIAQQGWGIPVEPGDVEQHPPEPR